MPQGRLILNVVYERRQKQCTQQLWEQAENVRLCLLQLLREWNSERVSASRRVAYVDGAR
jgi:hypothetical protein